MFRTLIVEFIFPLVLILLVSRLFRSLVAGFRSGSPRVAAEPPRPVQAGGELKKDPVCGTYVSTAASLTRKVNGQLVYFCSEECRDKY